MPSPFPGMNPYLEHPEWWSTVHNRLIVEIANVLSPKLLPKYRVDIDKRVYEVTDLNTLLIGRPDVTVERSRTEEQLQSQQMSVGIAKAPLRVKLPMTEEMREPYLEVKDAKTQAVVTAIEVLSPANKRGDGREKYLSKRSKVLQTQTNFVEIDLLMKGEPLPLAEAGINSHYRILVSRSAQRPIADLYAFDLSEVIPTIPIPLSPEDKEPTVDIQTLLNDIYDISGCDYFVDYQQALSLPLTQEEISWVNEQLIAKGLRNE